ncbi:MAG: hypothetical protein KBB52_05395 [Candidatus Omnitrophica bacterium]|nr:hypothetical protein [Candidatus Omnitrophota bacterium]
MHKKIIQIAMIISIMMNVSSCSAADMPNEEKIAAPPAALPEAKEPAQTSVKTPEPTNTNLEIKNKSYDFTDSSSWNLTVSAWEQLSAKDYDGVFAYANKCLELYEAQALDMARSMTKFASPGREDEYATVNDVATARYIMGEAYMKQGRYNEAVKEFDLIITRYPFAQCWDPKGWFWKVAEVSRKNLDKIEKSKTDTK